MNPDEQRIAIAQACGWRIIRGTKGHPNISGHGLRAREIPDYLNDLNAMHCAEKVLKDGPIGAHNPKSTYREMLYRTLQSRGEDCVNWGCATAAQRAEAFLKTLNLWKE